MLVVGAGGLVLTVMEPADFDVELHAPEVPHRARRYSVVVVVRVIEGPKPSEVDVPDADVCQYQFTPAGGLVLLVTVVEPHACETMNVVFGTPTFMVTARLLI